MEKLKEELKELHLIRKDRRSEDQSNRIEEIKALIKVDDDKEKAMKIALDEADALSGDAVVKKKAAKGDLESMKAEIINKMQELLVLVDNTEKAAREKGKPFRMYFALKKQLEGRTRWFIKFSK